MSLESSFVTIRTFHFLSELSVIRARLEGEGIECFVPDELSIQINPVYIEAMGGVRLQVKENDVAAAMEILADSGYIEQEDRHSSKFFTAFDNVTLKIPFVKYLQYELRLLISGAVLLTLAAGIFYYFFILPTTYELLTKNNWCVTQVYFNGKDYYPNSTGLRITFTGLCKEDISFGKDGTVGLPGFNSPACYGFWELEQGKLQISKVGTFGFVYDGTYEIVHSEGEVILKSEKTSIYCYIRFKEYFPIQY